MSRVNQYLGLSDAEPRVISLARKYAGFVILIQATTTISTTYFLIFVAEALGNGDFLAGMALVGILIVVQMAVQTLFDYPTGVIGDWIGQRYILATAFLTYSIAFYLVSIVTSSTPLAIFFLIYALMGFASSQQSGALGSWFDNNWKAAMPEDESAEQYGVFRGKIGMMFYLTNVLILIPGGVSGYITRPSMGISVAVSDVPNHCHLHIHLYSESSCNKRNNISKPLHRGVFCTSQGRTIFSIQR